MGKVIAICNQKGGVGKTTTAINLSTCIKELGYKVLLIDLDPQGNATTGVGFDKDALTKTTNDVLLNKCHIREAIISTPFGLDLIPSNITLAMVDFELATSNENRQVRLKEQIKKIKSEYDYIIIDCPPSLGLLNINALVACNSVIVPVDCQYYALEGLISLLSTIRKIQEDHNDKLNVEGVLLTKYDARFKLHNEVYQEVKRYFKECVYDIAIPQSVKIPSAQAKGKPISIFDRNCSASKAYELLANKVTGNGK